MQPNHSVHGIQSAATFVCILLITQAISMAAEAVPPIVASASVEAESQIDSFQIVDGWKCEVVAAEPMVANPVAFAFDELGNIFVCESFRQNQGVTDNRSHDKEWLIADLAAQTVEDRIAYHRRLLRDELPKYETQIDRIRVLIDSNSDGKIDESKVFAEGFNALEEGTGAGVLVQDDNVFFTCIPKLWRFTDANKDYQPETASPMFDGFGVRVAFRGHDMHGLTVGPDGRLYFSIGDRGYHVKTPNGLLANPESGAVFRCELNGDNLEVLASGLRNPQELAFDDYGALFTCDNNSDSGDEARWTVIAEGGDSGWRMMYQYLPDRGPFNREKIWHPHHESSPAYIIPPIANFSDGPSGLAAYPGTGLAPSFAGTFFLCDFRGQASNSGVRTCKPVPQGAFYALEQSEQPIWNILATDVDFSSDGSLVVSDWVNGWNGEGKGRLYRFFDPTARDSELVKLTSELLRSQFSDRDESELSELLSHADRRVRLKAQRELVSRGAIATLASAGQNMKLGDLARIHAWWGMGQLVRVQKKPEDQSRLRDEFLSFSTIEQPDEVVSAAFQVISDSLDLNSSDPRNKSITEAIVARLGARNPRIQYAAAMACYRAKLSNAFEAVVSMLEANKDADPMLRHAGIMALSQFNDTTTKALATHPAASVRVAAAVALRKRLSPAVADFLNDTSDSVCLEAARAIHDVVELQSELPKLAQLTSRSTRIEPLLHRILNANFRIGTQVNAVALANFAADPNAVTAMRLEALDMLANWENPGILDRIMNRYQPLPKRDKVAASQAIESQLTTLLAADFDIRAKARETAAELEVKSVAPALIKVVEDKNAPGEQRAKSLESLLKLKSPELPRLAQIFVNDLSPPVRVAALNMLALFDDEAASRAAQKRVSSDVITERQAAWDLVAKLQHPIAREVIADGVVRLIESRLPQDCWLNVREAAQSKLSDELQKRLDEFDEAAIQKASKDPIAAYSDCVIGGNKLEGKKLFFEKTQLSCVRCHEVGSDGGNVGPKLTGIAKKRNAEYLLEAIIAPNAKFAEGFETVIIQTVDGDVLTGVIKTKTDDEVTLSKPDGSLVEIAVDDIDGMKPGQSSMPADLYKYISRRELRDLVAYLASLDGSESKDREDKDGKDKKGHRK